eukprot:3561213-Rhodomonas_salina.1
MSSSQPTASSCTPVSGYSRAAQRSSSSWSSPDVSVGSWKSHPRKPWFAAQHFFNYLNYPGARM